MALLLALCLAVMVIGVAQLQVNTEGQHQLKARLQAQYALKLAVGSLQRSAGKDARVSASARILDEENPVWTGVWDADVRASSHGDLLDWLVSEKGIEPREVVSNARLDTDGQVLSPDQVVLLGAGTVPANPANDPQSQWVALEATVQSQASGQNRYAWWVGDEGVKARTNLPAFPEPLISLSQSSGLESAMQWGSLSGLDMDTLAAMLGYTGRVSSHAGLQAWSELPLVDDAFVNTKPELFHALGYYGVSLLTNVPENRLKSDLTAGLDHSATFNRELAGKALYDLTDHEGYSGIAGIAPISQGTPWEVVRDYYKSYAFIREEAGVSGIDARVRRRSGSRELPVDVAAVGGWHHPHDENLQPLSHAQARLARAHTQDLMPVLRRYQMDYYLGCERANNGPNGVADPPSPFSDDAYYLKLGLRPCIVLHNPYNLWLRDVALRISIPLNHALELSVRHFDFATMQWIELPAPASGRTGSPLVDSPWMNSLLADIRSWGVPEDVWPKVRQANAIEWEVRANFPPGAVLAFTLEEDQSLGKEDDADAGSDAYRFQLSARDDDEGLSTADSKIWWHRLERVGSEQPDAKSQTSWEYWPMPYSAASPGLFMTAMDRVQAVMTWEQASEEKTAASVCIQNINTSTTDSGALYQVLSMGLELPRSAIRVSSPIGVNALQASLGSQHIGSIVVQDMPVDPHARARLETETLVAQQDFSDKVLLGSSARGWMQDARSSRGGQSLRLLGLDRLDPAAVNYAVSEGIRYGYWGADCRLVPDESGVSASSTHVALFELPRHPLASLGALQHAPVQTSPHQSAYLIGNSHRPDFLGSLLGQDVLWKAQENSYSATSISHVLEVDAAYLINERLFDRYFFSTVPLPSGSVAPLSLSDDLPDFSAYDTLDYSRHRPGGSAEPFTPESLQRGERLANSVLSLAPETQAGSVLAGDYSDDSVTHLRGFHTAAANLWIPGGFNVNSTEVEAWAALLSAFKPSAFADTSGDLLDTTAAAFVGGRFSIPVSSRDAGKVTAWCQGRGLTDAQLWTFAESIVEEVRRRGPFLSMGAFVNRTRTDESAGDGVDTREMGALQQALETAEINAGLPAGYTLSPAYLSQADVLHWLAPISNVRSDTFLIRAYGDSLGLSGSVQAASWCEAVVQRVPEPLEWDGSVAGMTEAAGSFGRRFRVISFRWLHPDDI